MNRIIAVLACLVSLMSWESASAAIQIQIRTSSTTPSGTTSASINTSSTAPGDANQVTVVMTWLPADVASFPGGVEPDYIKVYIRDPSGSARQQDLYPTQTTSGGVAGPGTVGPYGLRQLSRACTFRVQYDATIHGSGDACDIVAVCGKLNGDGTTFTLYTGSVYTTQITVPAFNNP